MYKSDFRGILYYYMYLVLFLYLVFISLNFGFIYVDRNSEQDFNEQIMLWLD